MKLKKLLFNIRHWYRDFMMARVGQARFWFKPDSKMDKILGTKYDELLSAQLADRKNMGIQEIECHVRWSAW